MFCIECGKQVKDDAKFCGECGAVQTTTEQTPKIKVEQVVSKATVTSNAVPSSSNSKVYVASVVSDKVPANITIAIWLIWISTFAGIPQMLNSGTTNQGGMILFALLFMVCIIFWITVKLRAGKNWMRVTNTIFIVLGSFMMVKDIQNGSILGLTDVALGVVTIFLLYSESASVYFKRKSSNNVEYILREK